MNLKKVENFQQLWDHSDVWKPSDPKPPITSQFLETSHHQITLDQRLQKDKKGEYLDLPSLKMRLS